MPKEFFTERDIEDLMKRGVKSLEVTDNVVLTQLGYEKALQLGIQLKRGQPDNPPSAPIRPYISTKKGQGVRTATAASELPLLIRTAVIARLGTGVDPQLLDTIINRVIANMNAQ